MSVHTVIGYFSKCEVSGCSWQSRTLGTHEKARISLRIHTKKVHKKPYVASRLDKMNILGPTPTGGH